MFEEDDATHRRFAKQFAPPMALFTVSLMLLAPRIRDAQTLWTGVLLALVPLLPLGWAMTALVRHISSLDEMRRRQHFESGALAGLLTCLAVFCWSLMEMAGLPRLPAAVVLPVFCSLYVLRYWQMTRRTA
ncbi:MAG TPA: hypothetical protein PLG89_04795 [Arenimonas sp.]|nr:hypothetical protein [Arenimonas sp.]